MRDERGFTLVEVLAAFLIVTFVITVSLYAFLQRNKKLQQASELILAYQMLANESEYWRRVDFGALDTEPPKFKSDPELIQPLKDFETVVSVQDVKPGVKNVTLTIRWHNSERVARLGIARVQTGGGNLW
ncbi:MAG TPA: type II secretion system protein [Thermoanaerobaculia bacterium]|nr:type II secretion system protein [Thermoanaerobaculia bacterium]